MATVPGYVRKAARRGLDLRAEGYGGDGLTAKTIREARDMARGIMSDDKIVRANAWAARHAVDLSAPKNSDPDSEDFPGAGAVAHYLWGINPLDPEPARNWLEREASRIQGERNRSMGTTSVEIREIRAADLVVSKESAAPTFTGYAAVFDSESEPLPFTETIAPGAFARSLKAKNDVRMYVNHDDNLVLASRRSGTLKLEEDSRGLLVTAKLPDTSYARDLTALMRSGIVDSMSFGFSVPRGGDSWSEDGMRRRLNEVRLHEVSVVTGTPAYAATSAMVRKVQAIAQRTGTEADALTTAIAALMDENVSTDQAALLRSVLERVSPDAASAPTDIPLEVLRQRLDLEAKAI